METLKRVALLVGICLIVGTSVFAGLSALIAPAAATCRAENKDVATLKSLLVFFEGQTLANPKLTDKQRQEIVTFYNRALGRLPKTQTCS